MRWQCEGLKDKSDAQLIRTERNGGKPSIQASLLAGHLGCPQGGKICQPLTCFPGLFSLPVLSISSIDVSP